VLFTDSDARLSQQEADCRAYCAAYGLTVGNVYREAASGIVYDTRLELSQLRTRIQNLEISGVIVVHIHRIFRSLDQLVTFMDEMERYEVLLYCVTEDDILNRMMRAIRGHR
jgi:DNA invertase Pin-like site-specific DNA recombinase